MECPTPGMFLKLMEERHYQVLDDNSLPYSLNIVGYRTRPYTPDKFQDILAIYWRRGSDWAYKSWPITTLPGKPWLSKPLNKKGCAILVPGQYRDTYVLGQYKNYIALKQAAPVKVYRDNTKDSAYNLDLTTIDEGFFGIHIHKAGLWSQIVGVSSAGCQVFQREKDYSEFIEYCFKYRIYHGRFTYTLIEI